MDTEKTCVGTLANKKTSDTPELFETHDCRDAQRRNLTLIFTSDSVHQYKTLIYVSLYMRLEHSKNRNI